MSIIPQFEKFREENIGNHIFKYQLKNSLRTQKTLTIKEKKNGLHLLQKYQ